MAVVQGEFWTEVFLKTNGAPYAGVQVEHYAAGTSTAKTVWTDGPMAIPAAQPVVGDTSGRVSFYGDGDYRLVVKSSVADGDLTLYDWDPIKLTAKAATLRGENQGTSYPAATSANRGQLFAKTDGAGNITELALQKDTAFASLFLLGSALSSIVQFGKGADLASAFTVVLGSDGNFFDVTGTATITALSSKPAGTVVWLRFLATPPLTHSAGVLKLIGNQNFTPVANDVSGFVSLGSGNWEEICRNGILPVGGGGTGIISATLNGVLLGQGTNAPLALTAAGAASTALAVGAGGGAPSFQQIVTAMIADLAVSTAKIANSAVTQAKLATASVGTGQMKTAAGSAAYQDNVAYGDHIVSLNDWLYTLSVSHPAVGGSSWQYGASIFPQDGTNLYNFNVQPGLGNVCTFSWRYLTASDSPVVFLAEDPATGRFGASWCCDDPIPHNPNPLARTGLRVTPIALKELERLSIPAAIVSEAEYLIRTNKMKLHNLPYRALQLHAQSDAPADWLLTHTTFDHAGKLTEKR